MLDNIIGFVFRALVYGQLFFWWWLFDQDWLTDILSENQVFVSISIGSLILGLLIVYFNIGIGHYTKNLLLTYIFLYFLAFNIYSVRFDWLRAVSLMGLTVFFNSYYWEIVLHGAEFNTVGIGGITPSMILQTVHLAPAWFFVKRFDFDKNKVLNNLSYGIAFSFIIAFVSLRYLTWNAYSDLIPFAYRETAKLGLYVWNRVISLLILVKAVCESEQK